MATRLEKGCIVSSTAAACWDYHMAIRIRCRVRRNRHRRCLNHAHNFDNWLGSVSRNRDVRIGSWPATASISHGHCCRYNHRNQWGWKTFPLRNRSTADEYRDAIQWGTSQVNRIMGTVVHQFMMSSLTICGVNLFANYSNQWQGIGGGIDIDPGRLGTD